TTTTSTLQHLAVRRAAESVEMEVEEEVEEAASGAMTRFRMVQRMSRNEEVTEGRGAGGSLGVSVTGGGEPRRASARYDPPGPGALGRRALEKLFLEKLRRPGDSVTARTFYPENTSCGTVTTTLGSEEEVAVAESRKRLRHRISRCDILKGVELNEWVDERGK